MAGILHIRIKSIIKRPFHHRAFSNLADAQFGRSAPSLYKT